MTHAASPPSASSPDSLATRSLAPRRLTTNSQWDHSSPGELGEDNCMRGRNGGDAGGWNKARAIHHVLVFVQNNKRARFSSVIYVSRFASLDFFRVLEWRLPLHECSPLSSAAPTRPQNVSEPSSVECVFAEHSSQNICLASLLLCERLRLFDRVRGREPFRDEMFASRSLVRTSLASSSNRHFLYARRCCPESRRARASLAIDVLANTMF